MTSLLRSLTGRPQWRRLPWALLVLALLLTGVGAAFIWSAHSRTYALKHLVFAGIGCAVFAVVAAFDYRHLRGIALPLYLLGLLALIGLWSPLGITVNNARRWYDLGLFHAQPSEPMKLLLVVALADYFRFPAHRERLRALALPALMTGVPMALIALEPDFGTALMLVPVFFGVAFLGGARLRNLLLLVGAGAGLLLVAWFTPGVLKPYQRTRITAFLKPSAHAESSAAYNAEQAMLAICAGGSDGQGWGRGVLNRLGRVPERHTDFIFPVLAEEWGFAGTAPVVLAYLLVVVLLGRCALSTEEPFGRLLVGGVLCVFASQALLHMAISLRLAPITGLTLPLASYGGSSLVTSYAGFGLAASVRLHPSVVFAEEKPTP